MTEPTAANLRALEKTVYAYEKSIADLENGVPEREVRYRLIMAGSTPVLCKSVGYRDKACLRCVLYLEKGNHYCNSTRMERPHHIMACSVWRPKEKCRPLLAALRIYLEAILKRVDERGYELMEKK